MTKGMVIFLGCIFLVAIVVLFNRPPEEQAPVPIIKGPKYNEVPKPRAVVPKPQPVSAPVIPEEPPVAPQFREITVDEEGRRWRDGGCPRCPPEEVNSRGEVFPNQIYSRFHSVGEIISAFRDNEVAAEIVYRDASYIKGMITNIETNLVSGARVTFGTPYGENVVCEFDEQHMGDLAILHSGQLVVLSGHQARKILWSVIFHDCQLERYSKAEK